MKPLVCVSITGRDELELERKAEQALSLGGDLVELRLDFLAELRVDRLRDLISSLAEKVILTLRPGWEGGRYNGGEEERLRILGELAEARPAYVDLELATRGIAEASRRLKECAKLIVSFHDFSGTPGEDELASRAQEALRHGDLAKLAVMSRGMRDNLRVLKLYRRGGVPGERLVAFAMGEAGVVTRVLAPLLGSPIAYACLPGEEVAPGQLNVQELRELMELVMSP